MPLTEKVFQFDSEVTKSLNASARGIMPLKKQWIEILSSASGDDLKTIIYEGVKNWTFKIDNIKSTPPSSLPGKLLAFLFQRFKYFNGAADKGVTIISSQPNTCGQTLEAIILELAHLNNLDPEFLDWIENSNKFM